MAAGWPQGKRHELLSAVAVSRAAPADRLAAWLVATHHGHNRPFCRAVEDDATVAVTALVEGQPVVVQPAELPDPEAQLEALRALADDYGPWGLAFFEAILVSADRRVSADEGAAP